METVLVADDEIVTVRILERALSSWGYNVIIARDGNEAWDVLKKDPPPAIAILDWIMPGYNGIELCKMSAGLDASVFTYKIILSATIDKERIIQALHCGAQDVMLKPADMELLRMRLEVGAKTSREKRALMEVHGIMQNYAEQMEQLANARARQLVHAERMSSLGTMYAGIAHEINNPMTFIAGNVQGLQRFWNDLELYFQRNSPTDEKYARKIEFMRAEMPQMLSSAMNGVTRVTQIVNGLKRYAVREGQGQKTFDLRRSVEQAVELTRPAIGKTTRVELDLDSAAQQVQGNAIEIEQVLVNLIVNASQAMGELSQALIKITSLVDKRHVNLVVEDTGPGIPDELLTKIWDPFYTTKPVGQGTGLGLSIALGIVRDHQGEISAANRPEGGARFVIKLPLARESQVKECQP